MHPIRTGTQQPCTVGAHLGLDDKWRSTSAMTPWLPRFGAECVTFRSDLTSVGVCSEGVVRQLCRPQEATQTLTEMKRERSGWIDRSWRVREGCGVTRGEGRASAPLTLLLHTPPPPQPIHLNMATDHAPAPPVIPSELSKTPEATLSSLAVELKVDGAASESPNLGHPSCTSDTIVLIPAAVLQSAPSTPRTTSRASSPIGARPVTLLLLR